MYSKMRGALIFNNYALVEPTALIIRRSNIIKKLERNDFYIK